MSSFAVEVRENSVDLLTTNSFEEISVVRTPGLLMTDTFSVVEQQIRDVATSFNAMSTVNKPALLNVTRNFFVSSVNGKPVEGPNSPVNSHQPCIPSAVS
ncbi:unknown [Clostridium sp. CAG:964]|nr:unknown [Clostridium sp. CAG:964]